MQDEELQFEEIEASHTLGGAHATLLQKHTLQPSSLLVVYYKEIKRELNRILIYECRCDERLRAKAEGSTYSLHVSHTLGCAGDWNT
jgi:hypothetical protein